MKVCGVIFDRDGTLIEDVPYNGSPEAVWPFPGTREALDRLRAKGIPIAIVSNQSGVERGIVTIAQVESVNKRVDELLGPFNVFLYCPHHPDAGCECRKPKPKLIRDAAVAMGVDIACCVMVGDQWWDAEAGRSAGAMTMTVGPERPVSAAIDEILESLEKN